MIYTLVKRQEILQLKEEILSLKKEIESSTLFVKDIEDGKLDSTLEVDGKEGSNSLAHTLISMRNKMVALDQEEKQRNWATEGLANFVDILRSNNDNIVNLSDNILRGLVKYMQANQGWLFIVNDQEGEPFLELTACYAYDRKKHMEKRIEIGEGMVGQAYLEKETIYMTQIPQNYAEITSGLGDAVPASILIVPLKVNNDVFGILEIGSFKEIPKYQLAFVEKLAESIASTIGNVKVNERTKHLLIQTQEQTEQMRAQEEEMRQNMEELNATQEEMMRKSREVERRIEAINNSSIITMDIDMKGIIISANEAILQLTHYTFEEIKTLKYDQIINTADRESIDSKEVWNELKKGNDQKGNFRLKGKNNNEAYISATFTIILDGYGSPTKIVLLGTDITENMLLKAEISKLNIELKKVLEV